MIHIHLLLTILGLLIGGVLSWPSGAPATTCETLLPKHGNNVAKSASQSPYTLTQTKQEFTANEPISVTVSANNGLSFKGLIVQAYDPNTNQAIGKFEQGQGLKLIDSCSAVTHSDKRGKKSATLIWSSPEPSGTVAFRATVVQRFSEYFTNLQATPDQGLN